MNNTRRKELKKAIELLEEAINIIETVSDEEQEAFDNLPESIQQSERGEIMEDYIYSMDIVRDQLTSVVGEIDDIVQ